MVENGSCLYSGAGLGKGSAELSFLQGWQQSGMGGRGRVWVLPSWDEGAGEVWARSQSEDVWSHCERVRPGGGRGALPGTLLWLECQVRQDPGNSLCISKDPNYSLTKMCLCQRFVALSQSIFLLVGVCIEFQRGHLVVEEIRCVFLTFNQTEYWYSHYP